MLLYETDEVEIIFRPGTSEFLLMTFSNAGSFGGDGMFWGKPVTDRLDLNAIGIVVKTSNWFPVRIMRSVEPVILSIAEGFKDVIAYGTSMGGYGAIKFGRRFNASVAITFAPQFSIDPSELPVEARVFSHNFSADNQGMAIEECDLPPKLLLIYDPHEPCDRVHAEKVAALGGNVQLLPAPYAGHALVGMVAGTQIASALFQAACADDLETIKKLILTGRRKIRARAVNVAKAATKKHPEVAKQIFEQSVPSPTARESAEFYFSLILGYVTNRRPAQALKHIAKVNSQSIHLPALYLQIGNTFRDMGDLPAALGCTERAAAITPNTAFLQHRLAWDRARTGDFPGALAAIDRAVALEPGTRMFTDSRTGIIKAARLRGFSA